jgi:hypothetical protein
MPMTGRLTPGIQSVDVHRVSWSDLPRFKPVAQMPYVILHVFNWSYFLHTCIVLLSLQERVTTGFRIQPSVAFEA